MNISWQEQLTMLFVVTGWRIIGGMFAVATIDILRSMPSASWLELLPMIYVFLFVAAHAALFEFGAIVWTYLALKSTVISGLFSAMTYYGSWQLWSWLLTDTVLMRLP